MEIIPPLDYIYNVLDERVGWNRWQKTTCDVSDPVSWPTVPCSPPFGINESWVWVYSFGWKLRTTLAIVKLLLIVWGLENCDMTSFANGNNFKTYFPMNLTVLTLPYSKLEATASLINFWISISFSIFNVKYRGVLLASLKIQCPFAAGK